MLDVIAAGVGASGKVRVTVLAVLCNPHAVCAFTEMVPAVKPVLYCKVICELSLLALTIVVLVGLVHLYTLAARCTVVKLGMTTVYVIELPMQALKLPVDEVIFDGVAGKYFMVME